MPSADRNLNSYICLKFLFEGCCLYHLVFRDQVKGLLELFYFSLSLLFRSCVFHFSSSLVNGRLLPINFVRVEAAFPFRHGRFRLPLASIIRAPSNCFAPIILPPYPTCSNLRPNSPFLRSVTSITSITTIILKSTLQSKLITHLLQIGLLAIALVRTYLAPSPILFPGRHNSGFQFPFTGWNSKSLAIITARLITKAAFRRAIPHCYHSQPLHFTCDPLHCRVIALTQHKPATSRVFIYQSFSLSRLISVPAADLSPDLLHLLLSRIPQPSTQLPPSNS